MASKEPIHSMTGFGRATGLCEGWDVSVEMRSVNHRYCDVRARLPQELAQHEGVVRKQLQKALGRGRIDVTIQLGKGGDAKAMPQLQAEVAARYIQLHQEAAALLGMAAESLAPLTPLQLLQLPDVLAMGQDALPEDDALLAVLVDVVSEATRRLCEMRAREGVELKAHLLTMLEGFAASISIIEGRAPSMPAAHFARLQERLAQFPLEQPIDAARLQQEVAIFADRCDVSEELARLHSHLQQFHEALDKGGVCGRRLDFLCQELLRETNTIGSKNVDAEIGTALIAMKASIEKIREQVQNIE